jgi:hypothetical protein
MNASRLRYFFFFLAAFFFAMGSSPPFVRTSGFMMRKPTAQ